MNDWADTVSALPHPSELFNLSGRVALITGGGTGLGLAMAQALAGAGAAVVLCGRRLDVLQSACGALAQQGARAAAVAADLADADGLAAVARAASKPFGAPDIVVHAAGLNARQPWQAVDVASWDTQLNVMLRTPFFLSRELVPAMIDKGWGRILVVASLQSVRAFADSVPYGAAKGGVPQLVRAMAQAWSRHGINVNAIAPGFFPTALTQAAFADDQRAASLAERTAIGRNGMASDLWGAASFLASQASDYVTGQILFVDGGFTAQ